MSLCVGSFQKDMEVTTTISYTLIMQQIPTPRVYACCRWFCSLDAPQAYRSIVCPAWGAGKVPKRVVVGSVSRRDAASSARRCEGASRMCGWLG